MQQQQQRRRQQLEQCHQEVAYVDIRYLSTACRSHGSWQAYGRQHGLSLACSLVCSLRTWQVQLADAAIGLELQ